MTDREGKKVRIKMEVTQEEYEKILALFQSGELEKLVGLPILEVRSEDVPAVWEATPPELKPVKPRWSFIQLTEWFNNIFEEYWEPRELLLAPAVAARSRARDAGQPEDSVVRAKVINLGEDRVVALAVRVAPPAPDDTVNIRLEVWPTGEATELPVGLRVTVLDESGDNVDNLEVEAKSGDDLLALALSGPKNVRFSVRLQLGDAENTEDFLI
jgi:hypothetical protein